jgi:uncharacterized protein YndB with AHSA1/START domain
VGPVSAKTTIDVPRERVYELIADLANRPAFTDHFIDELRLQRMASTGVGAALRFRVAERRFWMESVIAESEPPHRLIERGRGGRLDRIPLATVWELVEGPAPSSCEVTVTFVTEPQTLADKLADAAASLRGAERWYRRQWARALARLKDLAESGAEPERVVVAGADRIPS